MPVPFYDGNKKEAEIRVGHKNLISPISAALIADNGLLLFQRLLSLTDPKDEKHKESPSQVNLFYYTIFYLFCY